MSVRVITPPDPVVTPADIAGSHAADDASVAALIGAVTEEIDGPTGWLGRAIGPQTLELIAPSFYFGRNLALPFPPVIGNVEIKYLDLDEVEQTVATANYRMIDNRVWFDAAYSFPATFCAPDGVRIRYTAGYNGTTGAGAGEVQTGVVPERVRQAIILSVQHLKALADTENLYLRSVEIPDVETRQFTLTDQAGEVVRRTCERLLAGLRIYS